MVRMVVLQKKTAEQARPFYEKLVEQFPNAGRYWKAYIEHEVSSSSFLAQDNCA